MCCCVKRGKYAAMRIHKISHVGLWMCKWTGRSLDQVMVWGQKGTWWCHQIETFSFLLALCAGNSPVTGEFPAQRPVMRSFDVFFDRHLNKRLSKQSWGWWFETPSCSLWCHCNGNYLNQWWLIAIGTLDKNLSKILTKYRTILLKKCHLQNADHFHGTLVCTHYARTQNNCHPTKTL